MSNFIQILILLVLVVIVAFRIFQPRIDIIEMGVNRYKVLLWYNYFKGTETKRKWVKLCEYVKR